MPRSLEEAVGMLARDGESKVIAGGQSLLSLMKLRLASPSYLVDISRVPGLSYITEKDGGRLSIGALTTYDELERSVVVKRRFRLLHDAVWRVGDQQVRNRGTVGGSVCHADPSGDLPTALLAAGGDVVAVGEGGRVRRVSVDDLFVDTFTTALAHEEILKEVELPAVSPRSGSAFMKHSLRSADFAIAMAGVVVMLEEDMKTCAGVRVALGAVGGTPIRAREAEAFLAGRALDHGTIAEASEKALEKLEPPGDLHGDPDYRKQAAKVVMRRAVELALSRVSDA